MSSFYLVDDDQDMIDLATALLEAAGHAVSSNVSAMFAISEILSQKPDCVIVDFQMSGMDGMELCRELRKHDKLKYTKLLMLSGRGDEHWQNTAKEAGASGYLTKPIDPGTFVDDIEQAIK